jgi:hypothetical protein
MVAAIIYKYQYFNSIDINLNDRTLHVPINR